MHLPTVLAASAATLAMAAPRPAGKTFRVTQVATGRKTHLNGPAEMMKIYNKRKNMKAPAGLSAAVAKEESGETGSVAGNPPNNDDNEYISPVTVGNDQLNFQFDTGSSDLWCFADITPTKMSKGHNIYNTTSGTLKEDYTWSIGYEDEDEASGTVYVDKVVVGGVTATSQAVEAATSASSGLVKDKTYDGLLGLGFSNGNTVKPKKQLTYFDSVKDDLDKPLFTVDLKHGKPGTFDFGYIDSDKYSGSITYVNVDNSDDSWGFTAGAYFIGDNAGNSSQVGATIADTGTTLMLVPTAIAKEYYSYVNTSYYDADYKAYVFNCTDVLLDFTVAIGGTNFTIPADLINQTTNSDGTCYGGIQGAKDGGNFGDMFLKTVFAVFDLTKGADSPRLGFAKKA